MHPSLTKCWPIKQARSQDIQIKSSLPVASQQTPGWPEVLTIGEGVRTEVEVKKRLSFLPKWVGGQRPRKASSMGANLDQLPGEGGDCGTAFGNESFANTMPLPSP